MEKAVATGGGGRLTLMADAYNLLNSNAVTNFSLRVGDNERVIAALDPIAVKAGIRLHPVAVLNRQRMGAPWPERRGGRTVRPAQARHGLCIRPRHRLSVPAVPHRLDTTRSAGAGLRRGPAR